MRRILIAVLSIVLVAAWLGQSQAVGLYVVGKEDCNCSPLVARGIVPDTLNLLTDALLFPHIAVALDKVALEIQSVLSGLTAPAVTTVAEAREETTEADTITSDAEKATPKVDKPAAQAPEKKVTTPAKKKTAKVKKKKRVRQPPKTM